MAIIEPEKTYTDNPFVDNVIYYTKIAAMNCVVKDEDEALANETTESLRNGDIMIACVEGRAVYSMFTSIPKEILEKYIAQVSNLDLYAGSTTTLANHLNSYTKIERTILYNNLSELARTIYIDHYDVMTNYLEGLSDTWMEDNKDLYNACVAGTATYEDLFDALPEYTRYRIIKTYLNNYDSTQLSDLAADLSTFQAYIDNRVDSTVNSELSQISQAMRSVFQSHYEMMVERGYVQEASTTWYKFICLTDTFDKCKDGTITYIELYNVFPSDIRYDTLVEVLGQAIVDKYKLNDSVNALTTYFENYSSDSATEITNLTSRMSEIYLDQYNPFLNHDIYQQCVDGLIEYNELSEYLPYETRKIIINAYIDEVTNLQVYSENIKMLNSYLQTLSAAERTEIKNNITADMMVWYPDHYEELNNYYRAYLGLPPLDDDGNAYIDTLVHSYDADTASFMEFGTQFTSQIPDTTYPDTHWKQELYLFDSYDINILDGADILSSYVAACGSTMESSRYRYLKYLGENKLDAYTCRKAMNFQLIGIPTLDDQDAQRRFVDTYAVNRDYLIRAVYADGYKFQSDYYNKFMIIFILINTICDMLVDIPELIVRREVFDSRCIKYLFESYGIPYYSEIPLKYQRAMLKNLNILIKYKSSTRNMIDICNLFGFSDVRVFGYYLFRQRNVDSNTGEYIFEDSAEATYSLDQFYVMDANGSYTNYNGVHFNKMLNYQKYDEDTWTHLVSYTDDSGNTVTERVINQDADVYIYDEDNNDFIPFADVDYFTKIHANTDEATLKFVKVPIDENFSEYKNDPDYIINYDEMVEQDEGDTWDGGLDHDALYQDLLDYEFNAVRTKYISVETVTEMTEMAFQVSYFYNMLFDNLYNEDQLTVQVPHIKLNHNFRFMDILCYLFALMYLYNDLEDNIMYSPTQILYVKGYNFDEAANVALQDPTCFTQTDEYGDLEDYEKENIFDINTRIAEDNYDYQAAFEPYRMRSFNLNADVDELEAWLQEEYQMSLDDFIVDDSLTTFDTVITLRNFFTLNNSYYQKSIFQDGVIPLQYNQNIKYAYDYVLYAKTTINDMTGNENSYVVEDSKYMAVIEDTSDTIYILDYVNYIKIGTTYYSIYIQYTKNNDGNYEKSDAMFYSCNGSTYTPFYTGEIGIINQDGNYIFAANAYYMLNDDGEYEEITDETYFSTNPYDSDKKILNFGEYYILVDENYVLDPDNTYVIVTKNGVSQYVLATNTGDYTNLVVSEDNLYVLHESGHFVKLTETDYYKDSDGDGEYEYNEEDCYVISSSTTQYYDSSVSPRVYYQKLSDYYSENNWVIYADTYYVKDGAGNYIPVTDIMDPNNTYYKVSEGNYNLVINNLGQYYTYSNPISLSYILVLQEDNDYNRYKLSGDVYTLSQSTVFRYVLNSDSDYVTVLYRNSTYADTSLMIVVLNKAISEGSDVDDEESSKYNPEVTDNIWDENDWQYTLESSDPDNVIEMNGENKWYYTKGGTATDSETESTPVGSGFYMESTAYIGSVTLEEGERYYMAFDMETNFTGNLQVYCTADDSVTGVSDRVYNVTYGESTHVNQIFTANSDTTPEIRFLIYDYEEYPIECGDYISISNIRFVKAYNDNYIAQDIPSYNQLQLLYNTNTAIYNWLAEQMANCSDYYKYKIYKHLYDSLMISKYNKEAFKTGDNTYAKTYTDFLASRDAVLYERLVYYKTLDTDTMHKEVADDIVEVTYAIDDCVDTYSYGYIYSYFPAVSASYIQEYITKIINFFKSWKVHLLGINTVYKFDDPLENTVRALEGQQYRVRNDEFKANVYIHGTVKVNPVDATNCSGEYYSDLYDMSDYCTGGYSDLVGIRDRVRVISRIGNQITFTDNYENMHLIFNSDGHVVDTTDGNLTITSSEAGFATANGNELEMTTDETEDSDFSSQVLNEINLFSGDYIEMEDK